MVRLIQALNQKHGCDLLHYTLTVENETAYSLKDVYVLSPLSPQLSLLGSSLSPQPAAGETLLTGVTLPDVPPGGKEALSYQVILRPKATGKVRTTAQLFYHYQDAANLDHYDSVYSNAITAYGKTP